MKCSVCSSEIKENYCPKCGQFYKNERISFLSIITDLFSNIFSLEKSFFKNIKIGLLKPQTLITNYWNGFRGYFYSPSRFLIIASLFFLLQILLSFDFLGAVVTSKVAQQFSILIFIIVLYSLSSYIVYFKYKKNFYEHLILNIYNVSLWSILFGPVSIVLNLLNTPKLIKFYFFFVYLFLIIVWNSRGFSMNIYKRILLVALNCLFLFLFVFVLVKFTGIIHN